METVYGLPVASSPPGKRTENKNNILQQMCSDFDDDDDDSYTVRCLMVKGFYNIAQSSLCRDRCRG